MMTIFARFVVAAVILAQGAATSPIKIGEVGKHLTDSEVAEIARIVSPNGPAPWLLHGYPGQIGEGVEAYLPPDSMTKNVRRGTFVRLSRVRSRSAAASNNWVVSPRMTYAQVSVAGRDFNQIQGDLDIGRPFEIKGNLDNDSELVQLVTFIRSKAGELPIQSINREGVDSATVSLFKAPGSGTMLTLRRMGTGWTVASTSEYIA